MDAAYMPDNTPLASLLAKRVQRDSPRFSSGRGGRDPGPRRGRWRIGRRLTRATDSEAFSSSLTVAFALPSAMLVSVSRSCASDHSKNVRGEPPRRPLRFAGGT